MPDLLREWYRWAGRRRGVVDGQNRLLMPSELKLKDGRLVFYGENQWVYEWGTEVSADDPPVYGRFSNLGQPWAVEGPTLSEFLLQVFLFEAVMQAPYGGHMSWAEGTILDVVIAPLLQVSLAPWQWPGPTSRLWTGDGGVIAFASPWQGGYSIWIGARSERPLQYLRSVPDGYWDCMAF